MHYSQLNYDSYDEYLNGAEWQEIHELYYQCRSIPYRCTMCYKRRELLLHKRSYAHLEPAFFRELIRKKKFKLLNKILSWKCKRCNDLCHFYDRRKRERVELDYLFLWEREKEVRYKPSIILERCGRLIWGVLKDYWISPRRRVSGVS